MPTATIEIELLIDYEPAEPESGINYPSMSLDAIKVPGFTFEQNESLWYSLRTDMEDALLRQVAEGKTK